MPARPLLAAILCAALLACDPTTSKEPAEVPVTVGLVALDASDAPVVVLEEQDGERWLPIWIGSAEATSIAAEIEDKRSARPNTHDLANRLIQGLEGEVERVVVTELRGNTYYAVLTLRSGRSLVEIDSRPSDAIAIALRADAPIFVRATVFDNVSEPAEEPPEGGHGAPSDAPSREHPTGTGTATPARTL